MLYMMGLLLALPQTSSSWSYGERCFATPPGKPPDSHLLLSHQRGQSFAASRAMPSSEFTQKWGAHRVFKRDSNNEIAEGTNKF